MEGLPGAKSPDKMLRGEQERRFVQLGPDSVTMAAETIGMTSLPGVVARALAEDTSYRIREVTSLASLFLKHSKKRKLSVADMNLALKWSDVEQVVGQCGGEEVATSQLFTYLPEGDIFVDRDVEVDLVEQSTSPAGMYMEQEVRLDVTASWLSVEGAAQPGAEPLTLTPALVQYYSLLMTSVTGDNDNLCTTILRDIRTNTKLAPLLPYLVTFIRQGMKKYPSKPHLTTRLLRLMSALFSNPHLNLSPKPYLSHLVTALLTIILGQDMDVSSIDHVPLASTILALALDRWATPVNQLKCQTLKHLKEFVSHERGPVTPQAQYGALTCLTILGPSVLCGILHPWPRQLWAQLDTLTNQQQEATMPMLWAAIRRVGATMLNYWMSQSDQYSPAWELYGDLYRYYGPSLVQEVRLLYPGYCLDRAVVRARQSKLGDTLGRFRLSKLQVINRQKGEPRTEEMGEDRDNLEPILTASQNFDYLADMGVPSDIFEPVSDMDRRENMLDMNMEHQFKQPTYSLSYRVLEMFPHTKAVKPRPSSLMIQLTGCRPWPVDRLRQTKLSLLQSKGVTKQSVVPWRQVVSGGRVGTHHRRKEIRKVERIPNYIDVLRIS